MTTFDWKEFIQRNPTLSSLAELEVEQLLDTTASRERHATANEQIIREGDPGDSIFFIGVGEVSVVLLASGGKLPLATLRRGEFFGEIALLENRRRAATVIANEPCTLLELKGPPFVQLLHEHPEIEFKILLIVSERLRNLLNGVLMVSQKTTEEKLQLFNAKLDAELRVMNASLTANQTIFEHTSKRANEVIESAERSRTRLTIAGSAAATIVSVIVAIFGFFGIQQYHDVVATASQIQDAAAKVSTQVVTIEAAATSAKEAEAQIAKVKALSGKIERLDDLIFDPRKSILVKAFADATEQNLKTALGIFTSILETEEPALTEQTLLLVNRGLFLAKDRHKYQAILDAAIDEDNRISSDDRITIYCLLLASYVLDRDWTHYDGTFARFAKFVKAYKTSSTVANVERNFQLDNFKKYAEAELSQDGSNAELQRLTEKLQSIWEEVSSG